MSGFGKLLTVIEGNKGALWRLVGAGVILAGGIVYGYLAGNLALSDTRDTAVVAILVAGIAFLIVKTAGIIKNNRVELFEYAMVVHQRDGATTIPYRDIGHLHHEKHVQRYKGIVPTGNFTICQIMDRNGNIMAQLYSQHLAKLVEKLAIVEAKLEEMNRNSGKP